MEVHFSSDSEDKINRIASEKKCAPERVVQEIVQHHLDHDEWFRLEAQKGLDQLDRCEFVEHGAVLDSIERLFRR